jgi:di/tricarboxylate transporter
MLVPKMEQIIVFSTLAAALVLFLWGRLRPDLVAVMALMVLAVTRVLEPARVFAGFGNEAVISVAAIFMMGRAVEKAGLTEPLARLLSGKGRGTIWQNSTLFGSTALLSATMNNTGALAILMPLAIRVARDARRMASQVLMPLAFASLLGGLITLIGTPPNILVAQIRAEHMGTPFRMFDFTPVGLGLTVVGVAFLSLWGWRFLPARRGAASTRGFYRLGKYFAEVVVPPQSRLVGRPLSSFSKLDADVNVVGLIRGDTRILAPAPEEILESEDALLMEAASEELRKLVRSGDLQLGADRRIAESELGAGEIVLQEVVITQSSALVGRTARGMALRSRMGLNVLAIHRQGESIVARLRETPFNPGDVLLVQSRAEEWDETLHDLRILPLRERELELISTPRALKCLLIFAAAVVGIATGVLSLGVAFTGAAVLMILSGVLTLKEAYSAVDWPVIVLLGATLPLGWALESSGGAATIARSLMELEPGAPGYILVGTMLLVTMLLSNLINNAATAVIMAPIAFRFALQLGYSPDTFFMAVAVGASCAFLTPIGHQCNLLVLGPGGYRFSDYSRLGVPLSILTVLVAVPLILLFWPLS